MNLAKSLLAAGSGGTLATGAYLTSDYWMPSSSEVKTPKKSISKVLIENKYTPLDPSKPENWSNVLAKYNQAHSSAHKQEDQLKNDCRVLLAKEEFSNDDYKEARRWCVSPQTVTARLALFNKTPLSTDDPGTTNDNDWKQRITSHGQATKNKLTHTFNGDETQDLKGIKAECKTLNEKTNDAETFEEDFLKSFDWCSKDTPS
ncbi:hypothetical protein HF1_11830 [Mycoplasma haemofelis str. Langford 1]|uniref:Uncharacterized protein n=1 Tax=Mycoplasma haemofelis (strain Langford 1) TaxID=941640 RepID=E8ZJ70_MYCHL|nr:hypothetical protein [Mycoplasma haemofelis]CBY93191.1 hypothetical protein HF1_11830 [Mycoplasma haemofelis str. Langford 1]